jgi:hypothetical protein
MTIAVNLSSNRPDDQLNECGQRGWELVAVAVNSSAADLLIFKRPIAAYLPPYGEGVFP